MSDLLTRSYTAQDLIALPAGAWNYLLGHVRRARRGGKEASWHPRRSRVKRDREDEKWSLAVRERDGWRCRYCGQQFDPPGAPDRRTGLEAAHIVKRGKPGTRLLIGNGLAMCGTTGLRRAPGAKPWDERIMCHAWFEEHPKEWERFAIEQIGQHEYDRLRILASLRGRT